MAFNASAVGRVRTGGNDLNGTWYDGTSYPGGVDYTQQDNPQATWTNLSMAGTTTLADAGATSAFTSAMVGNAIRTNSQWYFIIAFTDANHVVVDRSDTFSAQAGRVGGASATIPNVLSSANAANAKAVPGNKIYCRASGAGSTSAPDYTISSRLTPVAGSSTAGLVRLLGENGFPYIKSTTDIPFLGPTYNYFGGLYLFFGASASSSFGLFHGPANVSIVGSVLDLNGNASNAVGGGSGATATHVIGCEIKGGVTSALGGQFGISQSGNGGFFAYNYLHDLGDAGIKVVGNGWTNILGNVIRKPWGPALSLSLNSDATIVKNNTLDSGADNGITLVTQGAVANIEIFNNIIANFTGVGKAGISVTGGAASTSDLLKTLIDYNLLYNCTSLYSGISAGVNDLNADPKFVSPTDYRLQSSSPAIASGYIPSLLSLTNGANYLDRGALQHQDAGGGGTTIVPINRVQRYFPRTPAPKSRIIPLPAAAAAATIIIRRPPPVVRREIVRQYRPVVIPTKTELIVTRPTLVR